MKLGLNHRRPERRTASDDSIIKITYATFFSPYSVRAPLVRLPNTNSVCRCA